MGRPIYCRWCDRQDVEVAGVLPAFCAGAECRKVGRWSRVPGKPLTERRKHPRVKYVLSFNDRRFLRSIRVTAD